jgi:hypothetical protein
VSPPGLLAFSWLFASAPMPLLIWRRGASACCAVIQL